MPKKKKSKQKDRRYILTDSKILEEAGKTKSRAGRPKKLKGLKSKKFSISMNPAFYEVLENEIWEYKRAHDREISTHFKGKI